MNRQFLRAEMMRAGYTQRQVAEMLGVSESTFIRKMKKGSFGLQEANRLIKILKIKDPDAIFFDQ